MALLSTKIVMALLITKEEFSLYMRVSCAVKALHGYQSNSCEGNSIFTLLQQALFGMLGKGSRQKRKRHGGAKLCADRFFSRFQQMTHSGQFFTFSSVMIQSLTGCK
jgi:hypothetical protein